MAYLVLLLNQGHSVLVFSIDAIRYIATGNTLHNDSLAWRCVTSVRHYVLLQQIRMPIAAATCLTLVFLSDAVTGRRLTVGLTLRNRNRLSSNLLDSTWRQPTWFDHRRSAMSGSCCNLGLGCVLAIEIASLVYLPEPTEAIKSSTAYATIRILVGQVCRHSFFLAHPRSPLTPWRHGTGHCHRLTAMLHLSGSQQCLRCLLTPISVCERACAYKQ